MPKVVFDYDIDKDVENFIAGTKSVNNPKPTELQEMFVARHGELYGPERVKEFIESILQEYEVDMSAHLGHIEKNWREVEEEFITRTERIFGIEYPSPEITAYLTTNGRCTYSIENNLFFVGIFPKWKNNNRSIMHELLHFYTWHALHDELIKSGLSEMQYNDIKEALTVLLNIEYADLLGGDSDKGYEQHQELRERISELWNQSKDIRTLIERIRPHILSTS